MFRALRVWVRVCTPLIIVGGLLLSMCAIAEAQEPEKKTAPAEGQVGKDGMQKPVTNPLTILHISGPGQLKEVSRAFNLLLVDRLLQYKTLSIVPRNELVKAAEINNFLRPNEQINVDDIPALAASMHAGRVVLGWLNIEEERVYLHLKMHRTNTGANMSSLKVSTIGQEMEDLLLKAEEALQRLLDLPRKDKLKRGHSRLNFVSANSLYSAWADMSAENLERTLYQMLVLASHGVKAQHYMTEYLPKRIEKLVKSPVSRLSTKVRAYVYHLTGQRQKAYAAYKKLSYKKKNNIEAQKQQAMLLADLERWAELKKTLVDYEKRRPDEDPEIDELWAKLYDKTSHASVKIKLLYKAVKHGSRDPEVYYTIAEYEEKRKKHLAYSDALEQAANMLLEEGLLQQAAEAFLGSGKYNGDEDLLERIDIDHLSPDFSLELESLIGLQGERSSRTVMIAKGALAEMQGNPEEAEYYMQTAVENRVPHYRSLIIAGQLFLKNNHNLGFALQCFEEAKVLSPDDPVVLRGLAAVNQKLGECEEAIGAARELVRIEPDNIENLVEKGRILLACEKTKEAERALFSALSINRDSAEASAGLVKVYWTLRNHEDYRRFLNQLWRLDLRLAAKVEEEAPAWVKRRSKKHTTILEAERLADITFPELAGVLKILPVFDVDSVGGKVALFDHARLVSMLSGESSLSEYLSWTQITTGSIHSDLELMMGKNARIDDNPGYLKQLIKMYEQGKRPFDNDTLRALADQFALEGVVTYSLRRSRTENEDYDQYVLTVFSYLKELDNVTQREVLITSNTWKLVKVNWLFFILPIVFVIGIVFLLLMYKKASTGSVVIRVRYDHAFEDGHFIVRLSKRDLSQTLRFDHIWAKPYEVNYKGVINKILSAFNIPISLAINDIARLPHVSQGNHNVFITGVMMSLQTHMPIGVHEVKKEIEVGDSKETRLEINFEVDEAYVEVRAMRMVSASEALRNTMGEATVDDVIVEINDDPNLMRLGKLKEPIGYYLSKGRYNIKVSQGPHMGFEEIVIVDTQPMTVDIMLEAKAKAERSIEKHEERRRAEEADGKPIEEVSSLKDIAAAARKSKGPDEVRTGDSPSVSFGQKAQQATTVEPVELADDPGEVKQDNWNMVKEMLEKQKSGQTASADPDASIPKAPSFPPQVERKEMPESGPVLTPSKKVPPAEPANEDSMWALVNTVLSSEAEPKKEIPPADIPIDKSKKTIVIVDPLGSSYAAEIDKIKAAGVRVLEYKDTQTAALSLQKQHVDLVASEIHTKPSDGFAFCRSLKTNETTKNIPFVFISTKELADDEFLETLNSGGDGFFPCPWDLGKLMSKIGVTLPYAETESIPPLEKTKVGKKSISGRLEQVSLPDVLQLLSSGSKTGMLMLSTTEQKAKVCLDKGRVINCLCDGIEGEDAFYKLLNWKDGEFSFRSDLPAMDPRISVPLDNLLLEGFRRIEEG